MGLTVVENSLGVLEITDTRTVVEVVSNPVQDLVVLGNPTPSITLTVTTGGQGVQGPPGEGLAEGGDTGWVLAKNSAADYDTVWIDPTLLPGGTGSGGGGAWGEIEGTISDQADLWGYIIAMAPATNPTFTGSVTVPDNSFTIAKTSGLQSALNAKAPLASPTFTGTVSGITKSMVGLGNVANIDTTNADNISDGTTNKLLTATERTKLAGIATGATANDTDANLKNRANHTGTQTASTISDFSAAADARIAAWVGAAPAALDTLDELAAAINDDANFAATVTSQLALKAPIASPTFTGTVTLPGATMTDGTNLIVGTTTGTKIGTSATQKLGFFNATPIVQPGATTDLGTVLSGLGLRAAGTAYPITTSGAVNFTGTVNVPDSAFAISKTSGLQTALDSKAPLASPTFTGTVSGITATMVGLGSVPNVDATARANHTGTQAQSTIVNLVSDLAGKASSTHTHAATDVTSGTFDIARAPANSSFTVQKSGGTWPARPTSRTDVTVYWKGPDPSPTIVSSGTGGMLDNVDVRLVTT